MASPTLSGAELTGVQCAVQAVPCGQVERRLERAIVDACFFPVAAHADQVVAAFATHLHLLECGPGSAGLVHVHDHANADAEIALSIAHARLDPLPGGVEGDAATQELVRGEEHLGVDDASRCRVFDRLVSHPPVVVGVHEYRAHRAEDGEEVGQVLVVVPLRQIGVRSPVLSGELANRARTSRALQMAVEFDLGQGADVLGSHTAHLGHSARIAVCDIVAISDWRSSWMTMSLASY